MGDFLDRLQQQLQSEAPKAAVQQESLVDSNFPKLPSTSQKDDWKPPPKGLGVSLEEVCSQVSKKYKSRLEITVTRTNGNMNITLIGDQNEIKVTKQALIKAFAPKFVETILVPGNTIPFIIGKGGSHLKQLMETTGTRVQVPKRDAAQDEQVEIQLNGNQFGIEEAKKQIQAIVDERSARYNERFSIDRANHAFLFGPTLQQTQAYEDQFNVKIHVAPPEKKDDQIQIIGEQEQSNKTVLLTVPKRQHAFVVGPKSSGLSDVFQKTGCLVLVPLQTDQSDTITVVGPEKKVTLAMQLVLERANAVQVHEIDIQDFTEADPQLFVRYLLFKESTSFKELQASNDLSINGTNTIILQAKTEQAISEGLKVVQSLIESKRDLRMQLVNIPRALHRYVLGKQGQNITKLKERPEFADRLEDVLVPIEKDASDQVLVVYRTGNNDPEFVKQARETMVEMAHLAADAIVETLAVPLSLHGQIIGNKGQALKDLLEPHPLVTVKSIKEPPGFRVRGPSKEVAVVKKKLSDKLGFLTKLESAKSNKSSISIPENASARLFGENGRNTHWIVRKIKESVTGGKLRLNKDEKELEQEILNHPTLFLQIQVEEDQLKIQGPQTLVQAVGPLITNQIKKMENGEDIIFALFDHLSEEATQNIEKDLELRESIRGKIIGKEGRSLKKITSDFHVQISVDEYSVGIKGKKEDVQKAKETIIQIAEQEALTANTITFTVSAQGVPRLIGKNGQVLLGLREKYGIKIDVGDNIDGQVLITLQGAQKQCQEAQEEMTNIHERENDRKQEQLEIPFFLHRMLTGDDGASISDLRKLARIDFPRDQNTITITSNSKNAEDVAQQLLRSAEAIVGCPIETSGKTVSISKSDLQQAYRNNFSGLVDLMQKYKVWIWVSADKKQVTVCGSQNVDQCCKEIQSHIKHTVELDLPPGVKDSLAADRAPFVQEYVRDAIKKSKGVQHKFSDGKIKLVGQQDKVKQSKSHELLTNVTSLKADPSSKGRLIGRNGQMIKKLNEPKNVGVVFTDANPMVVWIGAESLELLQETRERIEGLMQLDQPKPVREARIDDDQEEIHIPGYSGRRGPTRISSAAVMPQDDYRIVVPVNPPKEEWRTPSARQYRPPVQQKRLPPVQTQQTYRNAVAYRPPEEYYDYGYPQYEPRPVRQPSAYQRPRAQPMQQPMMQMMPQPMPQMMQPVGQYPYQRESVHLPPIHQEIQRQPSMYHRDVSREPSVKSLRPTTSKVRPHFSLHTHKDYLTNPHDKRARMHEYAMKVKDLERPKTAKKKILKESKIPVSEAMKQPKEEKEKKRVSISDEHLEMIK
ncbi:hypothetical protein EDD86DRAFT_249336 [Gorgonomyces haynaldii]|nr:hypothetical protein EDD86DRAFT_249336 [Gorgonomyces haynaldii]